ncbi:MAG: hypothetical protein ACHQFZ_00935 [Acidimicrobiales bacterium]
MSPLFVRRSCRALIAVGALSFAVGAPIAALGASPVPTASSVIKAAQKALGQQTGVHIVVVSKSGKTTTNVVVDIGKTSGEEMITSGAKHVTITLTPFYAFVKGTPTGLTGIMGLTSAQEKIVNGRSISMKAGTTPYQSFKQSLTTPALLTFLPAVKGTTLLPVVSGSGIYRLRWSTKGTSSSPSITSVLTFTSVNAVLPKSEVITGKTGAGSTTFSNWGETVNPATPSGGVVTYKKVFG